MRLIWLLWHPPRDAYGKGHGGVEVQVARNKQPFCHGQSPWSETCYRLKRKMNVQNIKNAAVWTLINICLFVEQHFESNNCAQNYMCTVLMHLPCHIAVWPSAAIIQNHTKWSESKRVDCTLCITTLYHIGGEHSASIIQNQLMILNGQTVGGLTLHFVDINLQGIYLHF